MSLMQQLFRPEFLATYKTPLCSDAFSGFVREDPLRKDYNEKIVDATQVIFSLFIFSLSLSLLSSFFSPLFSFSSKQNPKGLNKCANSPISSLIRNDAERRRVFRNSVNFRTIT